jgi:hypothetical protein
VVSGRPSQDLSWRDLWPRFRIDLVEETARCVADNQAIGAGGKVHGWAGLPEQTQQNLIENMARIFLAQDQAMGNLIERAEADRDAGSDPHAIWREESRPNEDLANEFDEQFTAAPYDEVLDALMRSRGWWSRRRRVELTDGDLYFDYWTWGTSTYGVFVQCVGNGEFEAQWAEGSNSWIRHERLKGRQAVVDRLDYFESLRKGGEPQG